VTIGIIAGVVLLAFVAWAILHMSEGVVGRGPLTGKIMARHFQPQPEEQLTVGRGGLDQKQIDGVYTMDVQTPDGHNYTVFVDKSVYDSHQPGDSITFLPPPPKAP
jgi:hypothetical protein